MAVALWGALCLAPAFAQQLPFTTLSVERGLPQSQVSALSTDESGALWVGTPGGGLARFDGIAFTTYTAADGLSDNRVTALVHDPEGRLWIGTERGVSIRDERGLRALGPAAGAEPTSVDGDRAVVVRALLATGTGEMWVGTDRGLIRYDRRTLGRLPTPTELGGVEVSALVEDRAGRVWVGAGALGVARYHAGRLSPWEPTGPGARVLAMLRARDGRVWLGTDAGVFVHDGEHLSAFPLETGAPPPVVHALLEDPSGALWLGTEGRGVGRYLDGTLAWFDEDDGLGASTVWALALDLEGGVWAGTYRGGLSAYRDISRLPPAVQAALGGTVVRSILEDRAGRLWFATDDRGAASYDGSRVGWLRARDGLSHDFVLSLFEDRRGTLWFGTFNGLTRSDGRSLRRFGVEDGLPGRVVRSVVEDQEGTIWVGTNNGVARVDGGAIRRLTVGNELGEDAVNVLYVDDTGRLWAGTGAGLSVLDGDRFSDVSRALGLPEGSTYSIAQQPGSGDLWVGVYGRGLARIPRAALMRLGTPAAGTELFTGSDVLDVDRVVSLAFDPGGDLWVGTELGIDRLHLREADRSGGRPAVTHWGSMLGPERVEAIHNASLVDRQGRIWVGTLTGPLLFDPLRQKGLPAAPFRVSLTAAGPVPGEASWLPLARATGQGPLARLDLGSADNRAAFAFEAISLSAPSHVRYQYRLDGYDSDWSPATATAQAFYPTLPAGEFEFRVRATRDGRTWVELPRPFRLRVLAPPWRRGWFQALLLAGAALLAYGGHRLTVARLRAHERELQVEVLERERAELDLARTNRALRVLGECSQVLARATEEPQLLEEVCRVVVEIGGYRLCWVGWAEDDAGRTVRPVAVAGEGRDYVATARISWADDERGRGPTGVAIRTGRPAGSRDLANEPDYAPWRSEATARGLRSSIALPITRDGRVLGALSIYATETDVFREREVELLTELANDLAYGVTALRTRREGDLAAEALRESEARFRTLAETSVSAIFTYDQDDRLTYVNPAVTQITGFAAHELVGKRFWDVLPPHSRRFVEARRASRIQGQPPPMRYELAILSSAGQERWIDLGIGFFERQGRMTGVATAFDITERRLAEAAVEERSRLAVFAAEVATTLTRGGSRREMLQRCCEAMVEHLDAALGRVWTLAEGGELLDLEASAGMYSHTDGAHGRIPVGRFKIGLIAKERRPLLTNAIAGDPRIHDQAWVAREGLVSFAGHPLIDQGRLVGVIAMFARRPLSAATLQALESAANVIATAIDRTLAEEARSRSERRFRALIENSSDLVSVLDATGRILYASPSTARILGLPPEQFVGKDLGDLVHEEDRAHVRSLVTELGKEGGRNVTGEVRLRDGSGQWRWLGLTAGNLLGEPAVEGLVFNLRDTTAQKLAEAQLQHDALHDALTGLPNRVLLVERLERAVARSHRRPGRRFAVLFLDLDGFKIVNDSLGHETGDRLLVELAPRIEGCLRASDTCARLGGDEFVVLLDEIGDVGRAVDVAERIQHQVGLPFSIGGREVTLSASIGIVIGDAGHRRADDILRDADIAMYRAKARGRARYEIFNAEMRQAAVARLALRNAIRQAVDRHRLRVLYQPIVSLASGRLSGFEALVRWQDPERGLVLPDEFVPVAEEGALIVTIDRWVLGEACRQLRAWQREVPAARALAMNVNVSSRHFTGADFAQEIRALLGECELEACALELEITESTIMDNVPVVAGVLDELKGLGVRVAIDDFGTGYSSLAYLARLPVDTLKIDRAFVAHLDSPGGPGEIVGTIVALARSLNMGAIAEGVETAPQRTRLRDLGCARAQGYLIAPPLEADAAAKLIAGGLP